MTNKQTSDFKEEIELEKTIIRCVFELKNYYKPLGKWKIAQILTGNLDEEIKGINVTKLNCYGKCSDLEDNEIVNRIKDLVGKGYLQINDKAKYKVVELTERSQFYIGKNSNVLTPEKDTAEYNNNDKGKLEENNIKSILPKLPVDSGHIPVSDNIGKYDFSPEEIKQINACFGTVENKMNKIEIYREYGEQKDAINLPQDRTESQRTIKHKGNYYPLEEYVEKYYYKDKNVSRSVPKNNMDKWNIFKNEDYIKDGLLKEKLKLIPKNQQDWLAGKYNGIPDLFYYDPQTKDFSFVEIKSEDDELLSVQKLWFYEFQKLNSEIKYILLKVLDLSLSNRYKPTESEIELKGVGYCIKKETDFYNIKKGDEVKLDWEKENEKDSSAISVYHKEKKIGYFPEEMEEKQEFINAIIKNCYSVKISKTKNYPKKDGRVGYHIWVNLDVLN